MQPVNVVSPHGAAFGRWGGGRADPEEPIAQSQAIGRYKEGHWVGQS